MLDETSLEEKFDIGSIIGEVNFSDLVYQGCSSIVKICQSKTNPQNTYALKIVRVPDEELLNMSLKEFNILHTLPYHKNIVKVHDVYYNKGFETVQILMEYAGEGVNL